MTREINEIDFEKEVLGSKVPVVVDFWAEWCGPCRMLAPIIDEISKEYAEDKVKVYKLNVDNNPRIAAKYGIMAIPTVIIFKNGQPFEQIVGVRPKSELKAAIERAIK